MESLHGVLHKILLQKKQEVTHIILFCNGLMKMVYKDIAIVTLSYQDHTYATRNIINNVYNSPV